MADQGGGAKCRVVCDYHDERRPFSAKDAGRVICYAVRDGATLREILNHAAEKCQVTEADCDCEKMGRYLTIAASALALAVAILAVMSPLRTVILKRLPDLAKRLPKKEREAIEGVFRRLPDETETLNAAWKELSLAEREAMAHSRAVRIVEP